MDEGAGEQRLRGFLSSPASKRRWTLQPRALPLPCHPLPWVLLETGLTALWDIAMASGSDVADLELLTPQLCDLGQVT